MNIEKIIQEYGFSNSPIGLGGCKTSEHFFDSCTFNIVVFDEKQTSEIILFDGELVKISHASISEKNIKKLLQCHKLQIIQDDSWELRMFLSKIDEQHSSLFTNFAKNSLIESLFCCQKTKDSIQNSDVFASSWQKCASFYLSDAIMSFNHHVSNPSHMLESLRKFEKNPINEHISIVTQTVGIERATQTLLERMLKSTIGFSDKIEKNDHSKIIQQKFDFFVKNSMLSDCYFYLGYVNKENFIKIKNNLNWEQDLFHLLKVAFDVEGDSNQLLQNVNLIQKSCNDVLEIISKV